MFRTPVRFLWKPAVAASEWGHWLSMFTAILVVRAGLDDQTSWAVAPGLVVVVLFLSPVLRATVVSRRLAGRIEAAFGPAPIRILPGAPARPAPLVLRDLPHIQLPEIARSRHVYSEGHGERLELDLYLPADSGAAHPLVIVIHGGSWSSGDSSELTGMNRYLASRGYAVAAIDYRLAPRYPFPAAYDDVLASIAFFEGRGRDFGVDIGRIAFLGRSSGGHLALLAAYLDPHPGVRGVVAFYPPTDLNWSWERPAPKRLMDTNQAITDFLGGTRDAVPQQFDLASPILHVSAQSVPSLLIHGGKDALVSPLQSTRLAAALREVGAPHLHLELPWGKHGMDANLAGPAGQISLFAVERFLAAVTSA